MVCIGGDLPFTLNLKIDKKGCKSVENVIPLKGKPLKGKPLNYDTQDRDTYLKYIVKQYLEDMNYEIDEHRLNTKEKHPTKEELEADEREFLKLKKFLSQEEYEKRLLEVPCPGLRKMYCVVKGSYLIGQGLYQVTFNHDITYGDIIWNYYQCFLNLFNLIQEEDDGDWERFESMSINVCQDYMIVEEKFYH